MSLAVVVLNWNNAPDTLACLESLGVCGDPLTRYVVDNGSTDGSAERLVASGHVDVLIRTGANLGYTGGNNTGVRRAIADGHDHIAVLNNDTIVPPGTFGRLLAHLAERPGAAISPVITYADRPDRVWFRGGVIERGWPQHLPPDGCPSGTVVRETAFLTGCCLLTDRDTWSRVGPFDDRLFLIFEDGDWSMRARRLGVPLVVADDATVGHRVSSSFRSPVQQNLATFYFARNGIVWTARHHRTRLAHAVWRWGLRPALAHPTRGGFALLGLLAATVGQRGAAPARVARRADRHGAVHRPPVVERQHAGT